MAAGLLLLLAMASSSQIPWYLHKPKRWAHFQSVPLARLRVLLVAVFMLFSTWGLFNDLIGGGHDPYLVLASNMLFSGLVSILWILALARLPLVLVGLPLLVQIAGTYLMARWDEMLVRDLALKSPEEAVGIRVCATTMMTAIVISYAFFIAFIRREGKESFRLRNELDLAHGIQQTLVPPFTLRTARFEVYGISKPSDKVGGDLVDAVSLPGGDAIAYLGDIAGHGLQAGILMGMLKTATRTALLDAGQREPSQTLPVLLDRLNTVLPEVKEPHLYATFSAFRLCADGAVFYALAASPPILQWHANRAAMSKVEEEQFPLGLLPVPGFDGERLQMEPGDLLMVATDGILEVCDKRGEEFGEERLQAIIAAQARAALPELAAKVLEAAQLYGKQVDDQTILLIRRVA
jgi:serine phosphatase RsbU (regulator of sigma subunit)